MVSIKLINPGFVFSFDTYFIGTLEYSSCTFLNISLFEFNSELFFLFTKSIGIVIKSTFGGRKIW